MSNTKFTKGPWEVTEIQEPLTTVAIGSNGWREHEYLDVTVTVEDGDPSKEAANAHLIAAAPEMYKMLEELSERYPKSPHIYDPINALLAKARGES